MMSTPHYPFAQKICHDFAGVLNNFMLAFDHQLIPEDPLIPLIKKSMHKGCVLLEGYRFLLPMKFVSDQIVRKWIQNYENAMECYCHVPEHNLEKWSLYIIGSLMTMGESAHSHKTITIGIDQKLTVTGEKFSLRESDQIFLKTGEAPEKSPILFYLSQKNIKPSYDYVNNNSIIYWEIVAY